MGSTVRVGGVAGTGVGKNRVEVQPQFVDRLISVFEDGEFVAVQVGRLRLTFSLSQLPISNAFMMAW